MGRCRALLSVSLTESLRQLHLDRLTLDPNFDWKEMKNLMELSLRAVKGINVSNFIEFLRQRPNLEVFRYSGTKLDLDDSNRLKIFEALVENCGDTIQVFKNSSANQNYNIIYGFKHLKKVSVKSHQIRFGDLFDPIKRLAENTIEVLRVEYIHYFVPNENNCIFREIPKGLCVKPFSNLKTIFIRASFEMVDADHQKVCEPLKLLTMFAAQILSDVEKLIFELYVPCNYTLMKFAPKLRKVIIFGCNITLDQAINILLILETIVQNRKNERTDNDVIEIKIAAAETSDIFSESIAIMGRSSFIKFSEPSDSERYEYTGTSCYSKIF